MHFSPSRPSGLAALGLAALGLAALGLAALGLAALVPAARAQTQDLFVSNYGNNTISRFAGTGPGTFSTTPTTLSGGLNLPFGLAVDARGDLFASSYGNSRIVEFASTGVGTFGAAQTVETSLNAPQDLAFDAGGNLFAANQGNSTISRFAGTGPGTLSTTATTLSGGGLYVPTGLAFDAGGNLFVANDGSNGAGTITEFASTGAGTFAAGKIVGTGLNGPQGVAVDAAGDLFTANFQGGILNSGSITEFASTGAGTFAAGTTFATGGTLNAPDGLTFDAKGDLFVANYGSNSITEFAFTPGLNGAPGTFAAGVTVETGLSGPTFLTFSPVPPVLASLTFASPVPGGTVLTATVTLSGPAPADTVVGLSSSDPVTVRLFRSVIVPAGSSSATFAINTFRSHTPKTVTIQAALGPVVLTQALTITGR